MEVAGGDTQQKAVAVTLESTTEMNVLKMGKTGGLVLRPDISETLKLGAPREMLKHSGSTLLVDVKENLLLCK